MEVMSWPQRELPFTERIDSELTGFSMESKPLGQPCTVRFWGCSVDFLKERQFIGGERTLKLVDNVELEGWELEITHPVHGGPAVFRSKGACRGAICQMLKKVLPGLIHKVECWDKFVPSDLVERIVAGASAAGGESYACDVSMHVEVTRVYSEAEELLLLCEATAMAPPSESARPRASGAGDACAICMEGLADGGVTVLPNCSHAFHRECILEWFGKAPTCPCCRRNMIAISIEDSVCT